MEHLELLQIVVTNTGVKIRDITVGPEITLCLIKGYYLMGVGEWGRMDFWTLP